MINKAKVLANAQEKYANYLVHIMRSAKSSKLSGESIAVIEALVEAINGGSDFQVEENEE